VFSSEQPAVTREPDLTADGPLMEIFEKHRSELLAKQPVTKVLPPGASASLSSLDPGVGVAKTTRDTGTYGKNRKQGRDKENDRVENAETECDRRVVAARSKGKGI